MSEQMLDMPSNLASQRMTEEEYAKNQRPNNQVKPGKYTARAIDWGFTYTKDGLPQINVVLEFIEDKTPRQMTWFGSFKSDASVKITLGALINLGCTTLDESLVAKGREGGALDVNKDVEIVVAWQPDLQGVQRARVQWINAPGGGGLQSRVAGEEVKTKLPNFSAWMKQALTERGGVAAAAKAELEVPF